MSHHFFGYGSLVNRATHSYHNARPASLQGWRRVWVHTAVRPLAYLSVVRDSDCALHGLVAEVPNGDWQALDAREYGYVRHAEKAIIGPAACDIQVYAVPTEASHKPQARHPILLSYLDAVIQGFVTEYGAAGAAHFWQTTSGWEAPILNDRAAPLYPRAQRLSAAETALVDEGLSALGVTILPASTQL